MKLTGLKWLYAFFLFLSAEEIHGRKPEKILADVFIKGFVPHNLASPECIRDSNYYQEDLADYTPWAIKMYDASVKIPSGLITGNYKHLGNFDECLEVETKYGFVGQACYAQIQFDITANNALHHDLDLGDLLRSVAIASNATKWTSGETVLYELMWCVPSTCSHTDIQESLEFALDPLNIEGRISTTINVYDKSCYTAESIRKTWDFLDYCFIVILALFAIILVISTMYDIMQEDQSASKLNDILTSFSLYTNAKKLFSTQRSNYSISCADGIRCLSTGIIIWGHLYYMLGTSVQINLSTIPHMHYNWSNMLTLNANIVTDTFLLLSGMLFSYNILLKKDQASTEWNFKNIIQLFSHRYTRLTPAYAMMIGFYATLFDKIGTGPQWDSVVKTQRNLCRESWWTNLLYINNIVKVPEMCMSQSWYLSLDMQLTWLSPLILFFMLKLQKRNFYIIVGSFLLSSFFINFFITFVNQLPGTMLYYKDLTDVGNVYLKIYINVYTRFGPYILGNLLGSILHETRGKSKLHVWYVIIGWLMAISFFLLAVFWPRNMYFDTHVYNVWEASFYASLHRLIFVIAISWVIFCCENNYAGFIKYILSCYIWIPLSKLCYCAYLIHYIFIYIDVGSVRTAGYLTFKEMWYKFISIVWLTLMASVFWTLCFEMPFQSIIQKLFSGRKQTRRSTTTNKPNADFIEHGNEDQRNPQSNEIVPNDTITSQIAHTSVIHSNDSQRTSDRPINVGIFSKFFMCFGCNYNEQLD